MAHAALTAPRPGRRSPGSRCPFCSGPSSAPAGPGWASALPPPGLRSRHSVSVGGRALHKEHRPHSYRPRSGAQREPEGPQSQQNRHTSPQWSGCCLPPHSPPEAPDAGGSQERKGCPWVLPAVPCAHLMVRCSTWCMADTVFSQATCREGNAVPLPRSGPPAPHGAHAASERALCAQSRGGWLGLPPAEQS